MGSCVVDGLSGLVDAWSAREELASVRIMDRTAEEADDVAASDGTVAAIWFEDIDISYDVPTMRDGVVEYEETVTVPVVVQVMAVDDDGQIGVLRAIETIYNACLNTIVNDPAVGVTGYRRFEVTADDATLKFGPLPNGGHAARYEWSLQFVARVDA